MKIPLKDGTEGDIDPLWIKEWCELYWPDDVEVVIHKARIWCLDNPSRRKTKRGLRRFLGSWMSRDCRLKPKARMITMPQEPKPQVSRETIGSQVEAMRSLLKERG